MAKSSPYFETPTRGFDEPVERANGTSSRTPRAPPAPVADSFQEAGLEVVSSETLATTIKPLEPIKEFSKRMSEEQWREYEKIQHQSSKGILPYEEMENDTTAPSSLSTSYPQSESSYPYEPMPGGPLSTHEPPRSQSANIPKESPFSPPMALTTHSPSTALSGESSYKATPAPKPPVLNLDKLPKGSFFRRKLVIVGDGACGKTCLLMCVKTQAIPIQDLY